MQVLRCRQDRSRRDAGHTEALKAWRFAFVAGCIALAPFPAWAGNGQQGPVPLPPTRVAIPNRTLNNQELNDLTEKNAKKKKFDFANAERKRIIDDETNKLLILATDLKAKADNLGSGPLTPTMVREAEVIEILANDVKEKMKLTVSAD